MYCECVCLTKKTTECVAHCVCPSYFFLVSALAEEKADEQRDHKDGQEDAQCHTRGQRVRRERPIHIHTERSGQHAVAAETQRQSLSSEIL